MTGVSSYEEPLPSDWRRRPWLLLPALVGWMTVEPAILAYAFSGAITYGGGAQTQLVLWKVCSVIKGFNDTVCDSLEADEHDEAQIEVQRFKNDFSIKDQMLQSWPAIIYVFFAGALSDRFGRKWLICLPVIGVFVSTVFQLIHYMFIRELPMEFFYLDNWFAYTGGYVMYYMGIYAYASDVSSVKNRALRLAAFDGTEMSASFVGTVLSPHVFNWGGYYALYIIRLVLVAVALVYWLRAVKSPKELGLKQEEDEDESKEKEEDKTGGDQNASISSRIFHFVQTFVVGPLKELWAALIRDRPNNLRLLLYLNFAVYFILITTYAYAGERYLYMSKVFSDFTGEKFANMAAMEQVLSIGGLVFIVPLCLKKFGIHEIALEIVVCIVMIVGLTCAGLARNIFPQFILAIALTSVHTWQWSLCRSVFTKMVDKDEVGKVFTVVALLGSTLSLIAVPLYKKLYNATIRVLPAAFLYYSAAAYLVALLLNSVLFWHRRKFSFTPAEKTEEGEEGKKVENDTKL